MDIYESLREMLDAHPAGCPPADEIIDILKILFSKDEAVTALGLGFVPFELEAIAKRAGVAPEMAAPLLESLANKGLVFVKLKEGEKKYMLLPIMPGIFEFPFMKGKRDETLDKLIPLWKKYMGKLARGFGSPNMAFSRIVPIGKTIESVPGVLTYEKVEALIDAAKTVGLAHCACRESEGNCDGPREACMVFDETCDFLVERGFARFITKDEMKGKLAEFDEFGLIHQINNTSDKVTFICNCCRCCCGLLRSRTVFGNPYVLNSSGFIPECDQDTCIQCGACVIERCPVKALVMVEDIGPEVSAERCIGCGLCVTGCPSDAMKLVRREDAKKPAASNRELGMTLLSEKGKLDRFMPYVNPDAIPKK